MTQQQAEYYLIQDRKRILAEGEAAFDAEQNDPINYVLDCPYHSLFQPVAYQIWWNGYNLAKDQAAGTAPTWLDD